MVRILQTSDWQDEYKRKYVSPEVAVKSVKSGNIIAIPIDTEAQALSTALIKRRDELTDVTVVIRRPRYDLGWLVGNFDKAFHVVLDTQVGIGTQALKEKRADYIPFLTSVRFKEQHDNRSQHQDLDVVFLVVSPPDEEGFCGFGLYLSHKRDYARQAKKVLAEVSSAPAMLVKTAGDSRIHVSEISYFVQHVSVPHPKLPPLQPTTIDKTIAGYVSTIVCDGDTLQLGPGATISSITVLGAFDNKHNLGIHSAFIGPEVLQLVKSGVVNGKRKNVNPGKAVVSGFMGIESKDDMTFIDSNSVFEVRDMSYVNDIRVIAAHENMLAINSVLAVDLTGQLAADSLGTSMWDGAAGQVEFSIGSMLSDGGCVINALHSVTTKGISRIVPTLKNGTVVSVPRIFTDYVVTEYGIARLYGKSQRQRAQELIAIAHPDFRAELTLKAKQFY
ncbi:acetyl-CoA hydrolase/transferase family protein [Chloroflexota bacterium]